MTYRTRAARMTAIGALLALGLRCAPPSEPAHCPAPQVERSARAVASAHPSASLSTAPAASSTAPNPPPELPPRTGAPGSTRGTIACGNQRCKAGKEVCAVIAGLTWACIPLAEKNDAASYYECDDGTDCPDRVTCCQSGATSGTFNVCSVRRECQIEVCEQGGARCPAGQTCQRGLCWPTAHPVITCAKGVVCDPDTQVCHATAGSSACVSRESALKLREPLSRIGTNVAEDREFALLRCAQNTDCGAGFHCCSSTSTGTHESYCSLNCYLGTQYCATAADCPAGPDGSTPKCERPDKYLPPWSKVCQFE